MPNVCQVPFSFTVPAGGNANSLHHTAALQEIFLTSSLSSLLQMTPAQERTARHLKALMENMKIILGSNGVRNSVYFPSVPVQCCSHSMFLSCRKKGKGRANGVSSPCKCSNNKQSVCICGFQEENERSCSWCLQSLGHWRSERGNLVIAPACHPATIVEGNHWGKRLPNKSRKR